MSAIIQSQIEERINTFKMDIKSSLPIQVVRKHVIYGNCCALSQDLYFDLRSEVAEHFRLHPNEVLVVGSAKLGFSIAPHKRYRCFGDESDIDVVLVSLGLFDEIWAATFAYWRDGGYWEQKRDFKEYLFRGWIRPDKLPPANTFAMCSDWWEFFRMLTNSGKYGYYKIAGALYRSWYYLESYQEICAEACQQELLGG